MENEQHAFDTIIAPATPLGTSAVAVVRMDGPQSHSIGVLLCGRETFTPRVAHRVKVYSDGAAIDDGLATFFPGPHSYTGNDLLELSLHGNPVLVSGTIAAAVALGARIAEPGEFTERAVLNGKMDLPQAEAVGDLLMARTRLQARMSLGRLDGRLSRVGEEIRATLLDILSRMEAALDFADEGYEFITSAEFTSGLEAVERRLAELLSTFERGRATRTGLTAVILGKPNAGKSTLLNALCGEERAIVTSIPGTTRDLLRETIEVGGLPLTLVDTAGLRESEDEVETIGIERARRAAAEADILLYLVDASAGMDEVDHLELSAHPDAVLIYTKTDLHSVAPRDSMGVSAATGHVGELLAFLDSTVGERFLPPDESACIVNDRQRACVQEALSALRDARASAESGNTEELVVSDLRRSARAIGALIGRMSTDDVLHAIFAKFCIGK